MRFKNIELYNVDFDNDTSGSFEVTATDELIAISNNIRKRCGYTDYPDEDNDIYYNYYLTFSNEYQSVNLRFSVDHSSMDDYTDYEIALFPDEEKMLLFEIVEYLIKENHNATV